MTYKFYFVPRNMVMDLDKLYKPPKESPAYEKYEQEIDILLGLYRRDWVYQYTETDEELLRDLLDETFYNNILIGGIWLLPDGITYSTCDCIWIASAKDKHTYLCKFINDCDYCGCGEMVVLKPSANEYCLCRYCP